ncbi:MAG: ATP-binding protein, partial [Promethearchaeota archaeon]
MGFPSKDIARKISPYAFMLLIISVSAYLWISDVKLRQNYLNSQTEKISQEVETVMEDQIQLRFDLLEDLALKWPMINNESQLWNYERFTRYVTPLYNITGGFLAINFINVSRIISWIYPYEDNIGALNKSINYTADDVFNYALDSAFKTGIYNYTGIIPFLQGGFGFASYFPIYFNNTLIGVINGVFSFDKLLTKLIQGSSRIIWLEDYSLKVYDEIQSIFVSGFDFELTDHFVKSMPFILARIPLTLYLQPNLELRSQVSYFENISTFILGILLGVIIGIFILLLERNFKKINQDMIEKSQMEQIIFRKQKFESLGTLAGGIAHDFNNILSGIQGNMELTIFDLDELTEKIKINPEFLQNIGDLVKDSKENLHEIQELIQHSIEINRQITDFSSGSHSNIGLFNVRDILNFSINSFSNMIDKRIKIDKNYFGLNPYIICDSSQFKQVILNILINARDAMVGRDGKIEISIATQKREHSLKLPQKIQTFVKNNKCELDHTLNLIISIKDSGEGIPPENLEKIFDPFFT